MSRYRYLSSFNQELVIVPPEPVLWTPSLLPDLQAWFDSSNSGSITLLSSAVSQWSSLSGSVNAAQSDSTRRPTVASAFIGGRDALLFDGSNDALDLTANSILRNVSYAAVFGVIQKRTLSATDALFYSSTSTSSSSSLFVLRSVNNTLELGGRRLATDTFTSVISGAVLNTSAFIIGGEIDYANTSAFLWRDGSTLASSTTFLTTGSTENAAALIPGRIGNQASTEAFDGYVGELLIVSGTSRTTNDNRLKLEGYLAHKWGLTSALPGGHPFKTSPPTV